MAVRPIDGNEFMKKLTLDTSKGFYGEFMDGSDTAYTSREIDRFIEDMPTLTPQNEWASVEEKLPDEELKRFKELFPEENEVEVLVMIQGAYTATTLYWDGERFYDEARSYKVTHWMPLPAPPGKDNNVPTNEPLTIEELREMDGEPVWVVPTGTHKKDEPMWCVLEGSMALIPGVDCWLWDFDGYGETWIAYRRPPEGEEDT